MTWLVGRGRYEPRIRKHIVIHVEEYTQWGIAADVLRPWLDIAVSEYLAPDVSFLYTDKNNNAYFIEERP